MLDGITIKELPTIPEAAPEKDGLPVEQGPPKPILEGEALKAKAFKLHVALGEDSPGLQTIETDLGSGQEDHYRQQLVDKEMASRTETGRQLVVDNIQVGTKADPQLIAELANPGDPPSKESIVEEQFGKKLTEAIMAAEDHDGIVKAIEVNPLGFDRKLKAYEDILVKNLIIQKHVADIEQMIKNMGWAEWGWDTAKQMVGFPSWLNIITNKKGSVESSAWTTAGALEQKVTELRALPPAEMDAALRAEVTALMKTNPLDARMLVDAMAHYSRQQQDWDTLNDLAMIPLGTMLKGGKAAAKAVKGEEALKEATKAGRIEPKLVPKAEGAGKPQPTDVQPLPGDTIGTDGRVYTIDGQLRADVNAAKDAQIEKERADWEALFGKDTKGAVSSPDLTEWNRLFGDPAENELRAIDNVAKVKTIDEVSALSGVGKVETATRSQVLEDLATPSFADRKAFIDATFEAAPEALKRDLIQIAKKMPSLVSTKLKANIGDNIAGMRANNLEDIMRAQGLFGQLAKVAHPSRLPEEALDAAIQQAEETLKQRYNLAEDYVLDLGKVLPGQTPFNLGMVTVTVGKEGQLPFDTIGEAIQAIRVRGYPKEAAAIVPIGDKYAVQLFTNVGERGVEDLVLTPENRALETTWGYLQKHLGSKMQTSDFQSQQRSVAVKGGEAFGRILREVHAEYEALNKEGRQALDKLMHHNMVTERIPGNPDTRGMFFKDNAELEQTSMRLLGRLPTEKEARAYWAVVRANHMDFLVRTIEAYRRKASMGFERMSLTRRIAGGEFADTTIEGRMVKKEDVPLDSGKNLDILRIDSNGTVHRYNLKGMSPEAKRELTDAMESGVIIQPWDPRSSRVMKLSALKEDTRSFQPAFIVAPNVSKTQPLRLIEQSNFRPGFHNTYTGTKFLKQPRVVNGRFDGDTTALAFRTESEAKRFGPRMEKARQLLRDKKYDELAKYVPQNLPLTVKEFEALFKEHLDVNIPFIITDNGKTSMKSGGKLLDGTDVAEFFKGIDSELDDFYNPSATFGDPFLNKRDPLLFEFRGGTEQNPIMTKGHAELMSPMLAQTKAMGKMIQSEFYNDYQMTSAQHWVETFAGDIYYNNLPVDKAALRRNPLFYLAHGEVRSLDPQRVRQGEYLRGSIQSLVGQPSWFAEQVDILKNKLISAAFDRFGEKTFNYVPERMIPFIKDPSSYLRSVAFTVKLGLFSPVQLFVQGSSMFATMAISPKHGLMATPSNILMGLLKLTEDPKIIEHTAGLAEAFPGWTKQKFLESHRLMKSVDFDRVNHASAWRNDMGDPTLYRGVAGKVFLDKGPVFFNAGETAVKINAWNTAYLEYATKNPKRVGQMNEYDFKKILGRADDLSFNMTRDANAWWQQGVTGAFTQFWSYNVRVAELIMGQRLTEAEKWRLGFGMASLWGVAPVASVMYALNEEDPAALSTVTPWGKDLEVYALENGKNLDGTAVNAIHRGMVSMVTELLTGRKWDFSSRYGLNAPQALDQIKKNFQNYDPTIATLISLLGPSGTIAADITSNAGTLAGDLAKMLEGDDNYAPLFIQDLQESLRTVSSVNFATKVYHAWTGETLRSQKGNITKIDEDPYMFILQTLLGVQTSDERRAYEILHQMKADDIDSKQLMDHMERLSNQMWDYLEAGNVEKYREVRDNLVNILKTTPLTREQKRNLIFPKRAKQRPAEDIILDDWIKKHENAEDRIRIERTLEEEEQQ